MDEWGQCNGLFSCEHTQNPRTALIPAAPYNVSNHYILVIAHCLNEVWRVLRAAWNRLEIRKFIIQHMLKVFWHLIFFLPYIVLYKLFWLWFMLNFTTNSFLAFFYLKPLHSAYCIECNQSTCHFQFTWRNRKCYFHHSSVTLRITNDIYYCIHIELCPRVYIHSRSLYLPSFSQSSVAWTSMYRFLLACLWMVGSYANITNCTIPWIVGN